MVMRQFEVFRNSCQLLFPVLQVRSQSFFIEIFALPQGEVSILNWQFRQGIAPAFRKSLIEQHELPVEYTQRPSIKNNVMKAAQEHIILLTQLEQFQTQERAARQIVAADRHGKGGIHERHDRLFRGGGRNRHDGIDRSDRGDAGIGVLARHARKQQHGRKMYDAPEQERTQEP